MSTAPRFKLTYFDARGRAEVARLLLTLAGEKFEDERVTSEQWKELKPTTPQGSLPTLTVDGKAVLAQSFAIYRYLANEFGLFGRTAMEKAQIDMIVETVRDLGAAAIKVFFADEASKEAATQKLKEEEAPKYLGLLEKAVGDNGFACGSSVSLADAAIFATLEIPLLADELNKCSKLMKLKDTFIALPRIADYLKTRPETKN